MVRKIKSLDELEEELKDEKNKNKLIVVDFFATWCGPCVRIAPKIDTWSTGDFKDTVTFLKCDVDEAEEVSEKYNVDAMPTLVFFKDGKEVDRQVGADIDKIQAKLESNIKGKEHDKTEEKAKEQEKTEEKVKVEEKTKVPDKSEEEKPAKDK